MKLAYSWVKTSHVSRRRGASYRIAQRPRDQTCVMQTVYLGKCLPVHACGISGLPNKSYSMRLTRKRMESSPEHTASNPEKQSHPIQHTFGESPLAGSQTGYVFMFNGGPISWASRLQSRTANSTMEAGTSAACDAANENAFVRDLYPGRGTNKNSRTGTESATQLWITDVNGQPRPCAQNKSDMQNQASRHGYSVNSAFAKCLQWEPK